MLLRTVRLAAGAILAAGLLAACGKGTPVVTGTATPAPPFQPRVTSEYAITGPVAHPLGIALATTTSSMWFTLPSSGQVGQLDTTATVTQYTTPTKHSSPQGIAGGPNGLLWFTEAANAKVAQISPSSSGPSCPCVEFSLGNANARPTGIALGNDGNMWVTDPGTDSIWRVARNGTASQIKIANGAKPLGIISNGPDGFVWFTEPGRNKIGRLNTDGSGYSEYAIPTANAMPTTIIEGSDNALWFTERNAAKLGRMETSGIVTNEFSLHPAKSAYGLIQGIDGNYYFSDIAGDQIGRLNPTNSTVNLYAVPTANSMPAVLALGSDSEIYFTESNANHIGQFKYF